MATTGNDTPASPEPDDGVVDKINKPRPDTAGFVSAPTVFFKISVCMGCDNMR
jgi:hypothetical protein